MSEAKVQGNSLGQTELIEAGKERGEKEREGKDHGVPI